MTHSRRTAGWAALAGAALFAALPAGCSRGRQAAPVDPAKARQTLQTVLEAWKKGSQPESLKAASPSIVVQDFDWQSGYRLLDYQLLNDGEARDANLHVAVALTLRDKGGQQVKKKVSYVVGTDPVLTVFRELPL